MYYNFLTVTHTPLQLFNYIGVLQKIKNKKAMRIAAIDRAAAARSKSDEFFVCIRLSDRVRVELVFETAETMLHLFGSGVGWRGVLLSYLSGRPLDSRC